MCFDKHLNLDWNFFSNFSISSMFRIESITNLDSFLNKSASLLVYGDLCAIKGYKRIRANHFSQYIYFEAEENGKEKILPIDECDNNFNLLFMTDLMKQLDNTRK